MLSNTDRQKEIVILYKKYTKVTSKMAVKYNMNKYNAHNRQSWYIAVFLHEFTFFR